MTLGYLCTIGLAVVFMLFLDGAIGVMMLAFLLLMPILSLFAVLWVRRGLRLSLRVQDTAGKQQKITATVRLEKRSKLPLAFLRLVLTADAHFAPLNPKGEPLPPAPDRTQMSAGKYRRAYRRWLIQRRTALTPENLPLCLSMGIEQVREYPFTVTPEICGKGALRLTEPVLSDFLGMFRFRLPQPEPVFLTVMPEIPALKAGSNLFRSVSNAVQTADEETEHTPTFSASSAPGYEHRDYIPGDSLKRINWKLSSKRHHLMVRQDEPVALAQLSVVLDFRRGALHGSERDQLRTEEQLIETALGFLMLCAEYGYPCRLSYPDEHGTWSTLPVEDGGALQTEAVTLLRGGFRGGGELDGVPLLPPALAADSGLLLLCFTALPDAALASELALISAPCDLIVPERFAAEAVQPKDSTLWYVTPDRRLTSPNGEA